MVFRPTLKFLLSTSEEFLPLLPGFRLQIVYFHPPTSNAAPILFLPQIASASHTPLHKSRQASTRCPDSLPLAEPKSETEFRYCDSPVPLFQGSVFPVNGLQLAYYPQFHIVPLMPLPLRSDNPAIFSYCLLQALFQKDWISSRFPILEKENLLRNTACSIADISDSHSQAVLQWCHTFHCKFFCFVPGNLPIPCPAFVNNPGTVCNALWLPYAAHTFHKCNWQFPRPV